MLEGDILFVFFAPLSNLCSTRVQADSSGWRVAYCLQLPYDVFALSLLQITFLLRWNSQMLLQTWLANFIKADLSFPPIWNKNNLFSAGKWPRFAINHYLALLNKRRGRLDFHNAMLIYVQTTVNNFSHAAISAFSVRHTCRQRAAQCFWIIAPMNIPLQR